MRRLASASTFPLVRKARGLGYPLRRSGLTSVVSTATCLPRFACKPFTTHSNRLLSEGQACPRFKSRRKPLCRCPPASLHTRLHILSKGTARACSTPACPQAALWSPRVSKRRPHPQYLGPTARGRRSRRKSSVHCHPHQRQHYHCTVCILYWGGRHEP